EPGEGFYAVQEVAPVHAAVPVDVQDGEQSADLLLLKRRERHCGSSLLNCPGARHERLGVRGATSKVGPRMPPFSSCRASSFDVALAHQNRSTIGPRRPRGRRRWASLSYEVVGTCARSGSITGPSGTWPRGGPRGATRRLLWDRWAAWASTR